MPPARKLVAFRGPKAETFTSIRWDERNRAEHKVRRPNPRFSAALTADWNRVFKRKDAEHPGPPDRFRALVGRDLSVAYAVHSAVFPKVDGHMNIITIRFANDAERQVFFR